MHVKFTTKVIDLVRSTAKCVLSLCYSKRIWEEKKATKNEREQCGVVGFGEVEEKGWMYLEKL